MADIIKGDAAQVDGVREVPIVTQVVNVRELFEQLINEVDRTRIFKMSRMLLEESMPSGRGCFAEAAQMINNLVNETGRMVLEHAKDPKVIKIEDMRGYCKLLEEVDVTKKALELACAEFACDDGCPYDTWEDFNKKPECENCGINHGEIHQDTERDIKCWMDYYGQKARAEIGKAGGAE